MISAMVTGRTAPILNGIIPSSMVVLHKEEAATRDQTIRSAMRIILQEGIINTWIPTGIHPAGMTLILPMVTTGTLSTATTKVAVTVPIRQEATTTRGNRATEDTAHPTATVHAADRIIIHRAVITTGKNAMAVTVHPPVIPEEAITIPIHRSAIIMETTEINCVAGNMVPMAQNAQEEETAPSNQAIATGCTLSEATTLRITAVASKTVCH